MAWIMLYLRSNLSSHSQKNPPWMEFQGAITIAFGSACSTAGGTGKVVLKRGRETAER